MSAQQRVTAKAIAAMNQKLSAGVKRNKFGAVRTEVDGISFASKAEAKHYSVLKLRERAGEITHLRMQTRWPLLVNGQNCGAYLSDFDFVDKDGMQVLDIKGVETPVFKLKRRIFEAIYPYKITVVK